MIRAAAVCLAVAAAATAGCLRATEFRCTHDSDCGAGGVCEPIGFCSVPNTDCPGTGRSYGDSAGQGLSSTCVPVGEPGPGSDAGVDAPLSVGCPSGYASVAGSPHRYKRLSNVTWDEAKFQCALTSSSAYLAVPDDAGELANLAMVASPLFWIGLDDKATEGTFVTSKAVPASFAPWASGEPDNGPPDEDCVEAVSTTQIATERCGNRRAAVCECEP